MTAGNGAAKTVTFILDGREVEAHDGETIWQVANRLGTEIPASASPARA
jgi:predicted molibdopterin-dependent oxidoreductase YjgC